MIWSDKYRPVLVGQMVGNENARADVVRWLARWRPGTRPVLLVGPPGIGKTTMAFLLAEQFGYDMVGLNASDVRNKSKINEMLEPVLGNLAVTGKPVLIFIDEVDGIHGRSDYGGASALVEILKKRSSVPIILAANDDSADKLKPIKKVVSVIQFRRVPPRLLRAYLEHILRREDAKTPDSPATKITYGVLVKIINRSKGDIRSMINLAQSYATGFNPATETPDDMLTSEHAIAAFFTAESAAEAFAVLRHMQSDPREKINAFYSSVITSTGLEPDASAALLGVISDADVLYGRILRTQNWRLLRYLDGILVRMHDVTAVKKSKQHTSENAKGPAGSVVKYSQYNLPWPLLTRIRFDGAKIRALSADMRHVLHVSSSTFGALYMPYMLFCLKKGMLAMPDPKEDEHAEILAKEVQRLAK